MSPRHFPAKTARIPLRTTLEPVPLVTAREAADALGVGIGAVENWCARDLLPGVFRTPGGAKGYGHWRIPAATLDDLRAGRLRPE